MPDKLTGLDREASRRRLGIPGYDMAPRFAVAGIVEASNGLGTLEELAIIQVLAPDAPLKIAVP
ncbi:MAG: hypothetical protein OXD42_08895 [Rhodospirillaceae bacterium]|nr:hypothetical protein [Rhodospirillaceae bacterium]